MEKYASLIRKVEGVGFYSLIFMWLMPWGSFDLKQPGFWTSIILGAYIYFFVPFVIKKFQTKKTEKPGI
jgi:hypothetical protein